MMGAISPRHELTARSRASGKNLFVVLPRMASFYSEVEASGKPGAVDDLPDAIVASPDCRG